MTAVTISITNSSRWLKVSTLYLMMPLSGLDLDKRLSRTVITMCRVSPGMTWRGQRTFSKPMPTSPLATFAKGVCKFQLHGYGRRVPTADRQLPEQAAFCGFIVEMLGLWIEFVRKGDTAFSLSTCIAEAFELLPCSKIFVVKFVCHRIFPCARFKIICMISTYLSSLHLGR